MKKLAGLGVVATLLVAVAHLPPVSGWLGWNRHSGSGSCPFGYGKPAETPRAVALHGTHDALGFTLGATTRADVIAWAGKSGVWCSPAKGGSELACSEAPLAGMPAKSIWFELAGGGDVVSEIRTVRRAPSAEPVASTFSQLSEGASITGSTADLDKGAGRQVAAEVRQSHYASTLRATNMGNGFVLTERYALL
jgi:hypothetical protein